MMNESITLNKAFLGWQWFDKPEMVQLFLYLLLQANREPKQWQGVTIMPGQLVTSRNDIHKATGLSDRTIRTCIDRLKATNEMTSKTTNKHTVITICKYANYIDHEYVGDQQNDQQIDQQTTSKKGASTTNGSGKASPPAKRFTKPTLLEVKDFLREKSISIDAERFYNYYESNGWKVGKNPMKDWRAAVRTWARQNTQSKSADVGVVLRDNNPDKYNAKLW